MIRKHKSKRVRKSRATEKKESKIIDVINFAFANETQLLLMNNSSHIFSLLLILFPFLRAEWFLWLGFSILVQFQRSDDEMASVLLRVVHSTIFTDSC